MNFVLYCAAISKYLRHSEATSAKHYDFGVTDQRARNRVVNLIGGKTVLLLILTVNE